MKNIRTILLLLAVLGLPGCTTLLTSMMGGNLHEGPRVFSGTVAHANGIWSRHMPWNAESYWLPQNGVIVPFWLPLDVPLSLAADILLLPYTIPAQLAWGNFELPVETPR